MIYHSKSLVLVRKGRAFYATLYQEVFFGNPGGGGSSFGLTFQIQEVDITRAATMAYEDKGPPPASEQWIRRLPTVVVIREDFLDETNRHCSICFEENLVGDRVARLPCGHLYHRNCIIDWLKVRCTCPICRYELPTAEPDYEEGRIERMSLRRPRLRRQNLQRMLSWELKELAFDRLKLPGRDELLLKRGDLIDRILHSGKVDILSESGLVEYKLSELKTMRVRALRKVMAAAGVFFESRDVVEKEDMIQIFVHSGRLQLIPQHEPPRDEQPERIATTSNESDQRIEKGGIKTKKLNEANEQVPITFIKTKRMYIESVGDNSTKYWPFDILNYAFGSCLS